jgi:predicted enzyme related to lactoylglutathione lyase
MADPATQLAAGTPIWVDLSTPDIEASRSFYRDLFGWTAEVGGPESGGYAVASLDGRRVAGIGPLNEVEGAHPAWNTYVRSDDVAETARRVTAAGGQVIVEPMQVMDQGTMAVFRDPSGAFFSAWQPGANTGAEVFNQPGSLTWNELGTRDLPAARSFYAAVFGWDAAGDDGQYVEWKVAGRSVGGMMDITETLPAQVPAHWLVYFAVADVDSSAEQVKQLGGTVRMPPFDVAGVGRMAVVSDPHGAVLAIITMSAGH